MTGCRSVATSVNGAKKKDLLMAAPSAALASTLAPSALDMPADVATTSALMNV